MQMTEETLKLIQQTAIDAAGVVVHGYPADPRRVIVAQGGTHQFEDVPPPLRDHHVNSLSDLIEYAKWFASPPETPPIGQATSKPPSVVFHGPDRVVLVLNDADRRDQVVFPLEFSSQYETLCGLMKPVEMGQWAFIRLLRVVLGQDASIVDQFRKLEWKATDDTTGEAKHGNDSLGNAIMAKVQGIEDLPDKLDIVVPVYANYAYTIKDAKPSAISCAVEINTHEKKLDLTPLPGQLDKELDLTQSCIGADLKTGLGKDIPVFYGSPEAIVGARLSDS